LNSKKYLSKTRYGEKPKDLDDFYNKLKQLEITDNEKYSYPPLIIGDFHVIYMNFKLCDNVQRLNTLKDISLKLMLLLGQLINKSYLSGMGPETNLISLFTK
jgi:hypothetical protein